MREEEYQRWRAMVVLLYLVSRCLPIFIQNGEGGIILEMESNSITFLFNLKVCTKQGSCKIPPIILELYAISQTVSTVDRRLISANESPWLYHVHFMQNNPFILDY